MKNDKIWVNVSECENENFYEDTRDTPKTKTDAIKAMIADMMMAIKWNENFDFRKITLTLDGGAEYVYSIKTMDELDK